MAIYARAQQAVITWAAAGTLSNAIPAAAAGSRILVMSASFATTATAGTATIQSHTTTANKLILGLALTAPPAVMPYNPDGWLLGAPGEGLDVVIAGSTAGSGVINYVVL